jgi:hypothetical protein
MLKSPGWSSSIRLRGKKKKFFSSWKRELVLQFQVEKENKFSFDFEKKFSKCQTNKALDEFKFDFMFEIKKKKIVLNRFNDPVTKKKFGIVKTLWKKNSKDIRILSAARTNWPYEQARRAHHAFNDSMTHVRLQFASLIAIRYDLHRLPNRSIHHVQLCLKKFFCERILQLLKNKKKTKRKKKCKILFSNVAFFFPFAFSV